MTDKERSARRRLLKPEETREGKRRCYLANREHYIEMTNAWKRANPEKRKAIQARYYERHKEACAERSAKHRNANRAQANAAEARRREMKRELYRMAVRRWELCHPEKSQANKAMRTAAKRRAAPPWLTPEHKLEIAEFYGEAMRAGRVTGVSYHVDHIEPIRGKDRCGLHVPWNLQVLPAAENCRKGNRPEGPREVE